MVNLINSSRAAGLTSQNQASMGGRRKEKNTKTAFMFVNNMMPSK